MNFFSYSTCLLASVCILLSKVAVLGQTNTSDVGADTAVAQGETNTAPASAPEPSDIITTNGITYKKARVLRVYSDGLRIRHSAGIARVPFSYLPEAVQRQYGYDPVKVEAARRQQEEAQAAKRKADQAPLQGRDLVAWKFAREAAEEKCAEMSQPVRVHVPHGAATAGSAAAYAMIANSQYAAAAPSYSVAATAEPLHRDMTKSKTGDWLFSIPVDASYYSTEKMTRVPKREQMVVKVTDYETEIRVEDVRLVSE